MSFTLSQLAAHAAKALQKISGPVTLAYSWPGAWTGADAITVEGNELPLRYCSSPLELREALASMDQTSLILLVSIPENHLGQDVLARLFRHRLLHIDRWQLVQEAFGVTQIDPRLFALNWMPEILLNSVPAKRIALATVLTLDEAVESCLAPIFNTEARTLDLQGLLLACEHSGQRWMALDSASRDVFRQQLVARLGPLAAVLLATMEAGNGHAIHGMGLVCEVLYAPAATQIQELRDARVRLEQRLNGHRLKEAEGKQWADLARSLVNQRESGQRQKDFKLAVELLDAIGASAFVGLSSVLPESLDHRLTELGEAVSRFVRSSTALPEVESAAHRVLAHQLPPTDNPGPDCARMVARLCRYVAQVDTSSASDLVADYLNNGAHEDWARRVLRGARPEALAQAVTQLLDRIASRRMTSDEAFATVLVQTAAIGDAPAGVLPIENALPALVAPLAQSNPILMVVMDGMSQDVYLAIAESMATRGWHSWTRERWPRALLATTPSVTECSRASLLAGRLTKGVAAQEKQAFTQHEGLKRASKASKPPLLFHKAGLEQGHQLTTEVASAIADSDQRVIGIVINAIDDALAKSDQVRIDWVMDSIPLLAAVLEHARRAGRVVVLTSDHGHVLERQSKLRPDGEGERWRRVGREVEAGEVLVSGPRIEALMGAPLVMPWSESIRYAPKKNGYHGGVSRQEMLVPFGIWTSGDPPESAEQDFYLSHPVAPGWWSATDDVQPAPRPAPRRAGNTPVVVEDLFSTAPVDEWLEQFMASTLLTRQRERAGRMALDANRLRMLLARLRHGDGRCSIEQLASAIGQPVLRMRGIISAMERMLNLDGFPIVTLEQGTDTVRLDVSLLKTQFLS